MLRKRHSKRIAVKHLAEDERKRIIDLNYKDLIKRTNIVELTVLTYQNDYIPIDLLDASLRALHRGLKKPHKWNQCQLEDIQFRENSYYSYHSAVFGRMGPRTHGLRKIAALSYSEIKTKTNVNRLIADECAKTLTQSARERIVQTVFYILRYHFNLWPRCLLEKIRLVEMDKDDGLPMVQMSFDDFVCQTNVVGLLIETERNCSDSIVVLYKHLKQMYSLHEDPQTLRKASKAQKDLLAKMRRKNAVDHVDHQPDARMKRMKNMSYDEFFNSTHAPRMIYDEWQRENISKITSELIDSVCQVFYKVLKHHFELWSKCALKNVRFAEEEYVPPTTSADKNGNRPMQATDAAQGKRISAPPEQHITTKAKVANKHKENVIADGAPAKRIRPCPKSKKDLYAKKETTTSPKAGPSHQKDNTHTSIETSTEYPTEFQKRIKAMNWKQFVKRTNILDLLRHPPNGVQAPVKEDNIKLCSNQWLKNCQNERLYKHWHKSRSILKYIRPIDAADAILSANASSSSNQIEIVSSLYLKMFL